MCIRDRYEGHYLQLAGVLGVEKETGFTLGYDKYNWDEHPGHFILADCTKPVDFGEGKKGIYALPDTEILVCLLYTSLLRSDVHGGRPRVLRQGHAL